MPRYSLRTMMIWLAVGPMVLAALPIPLAFAQKNADPGRALYGEWVVVEMIYHSKVQDFGGQSGGWMKFENGTFAMALEDHRYGAKSPCTIGFGTIDIRQRLLGDERETLTKVLYELKDGKLRWAWREDNGELPASFDEAFKDPQVTLYVLKKVK